VSPGDVSIDSALRLLVRSVPDREREVLAGAIEEAYSAAVASLESDLGRAHSRELEDRHAELAAHPRRPAAGAPALAPDAWLLVLSHLSPGTQRLLQATYEDLQRASEAGALEEGDEMEGAAPDVSLQITPAEALLAELPHTSFAPGPADHDLLRRTLSIDVYWEDLADDDADPAVAVRVLWRDGYETLIADMSGNVSEARLCWTLEVHDPAPGRSATRLGAMRSDDAREAAAGDLAAALAWANRELGDRYGILGEPKGT
jgi:hypothetical protein